MMVVDVVVVDIIVVVVVVMVMVVIVAMLVLVSLNMDRQWCLAEAYEEVEFRNCCVGKARRPVLQGKPRIEKCGADSLRVVL